MTRAARVAVATWIAATFAGIAPAAAQHHVFGESDRSMAFGVRFGSFTPGVDDQFDFSPGPYKTIFGSDGDLSFAFVADIHVFQRFGTLSLGGSVGYWNTTGKGIPEAGSSASDTTEFQIWPFQGQATYRFDPFADTVPLVPVLRAGVDYYAWEIQNGAGNTAKFDADSDALGGTWGYHYSLGVHLLLDFFAPEMALDFDRDAGVNSSYLTFDYEVSTIDDFGSADSIRLGAKTFYFGLAIDL